DPGRRGWPGQGIPPHSITSSALLQERLRMVRASAFTVLRLTTNSNLVGSWSGARDDRADHALQEGAWWIDQFEPHAGQCPTWQPSGMQFQGGLLLHTSGRRSRLAVCNRILSLSC